MMRNDRYKNQIKYIAVAFTLLLASGCEKDVGEPQFPVNQKVLFQYEYINYAWLYQHSGWIIDSSGSVYCYHNPDSWNYPDTSGYISGSDLEENLSAIDSTCFVMDREALIEKVKLLERVSIEDLTEPQQVMSDAGIRTYLGYAYDPDRNVYRPMVLQQEGDIQVGNTSEAAMQLVEWLEGINRIVGLKQTYQEKSN